MIPGDVLMTALVCLRVLDASGMTPEDCRTDTIVHVTRSDEHTRETKLGKER